MADATTVATPGPGHNSQRLNLAQALDAEQLLADLQADTADLFRRTEELSAAFERFNDLTKNGITSEEVQGRAGDFVRQLSAQLATVDARRTAVKAPVLAAQRTIDGFFGRDLADPLRTAKDAVTRRMDDFVRRQAEEARRAAAEAAERQRAEAARLAAEAERQASPQLLTAAVEAEEQAEAMAAAPAALAPVRSDYGTTVHARKTPWKVRVTDISKVPPQYLLINEQVLLATAKTDPRIAGGEQPIPGVEFYRELKAGVR